MSYHITLDTDSAYDNPTTNENTSSSSENSNFVEKTTCHHESDTANKTGPVSDYQSSTSIISGSRNHRLLLPESDKPLRKVSALAALCPTNVNSSPIKQVTISPSPSNIAIDKDGKIGLTCQRGIFNIWFKSQGYS